VAFGHRASCPPTLPDRIVLQVQRSLSNTGSFDLAIPRERTGTPTPALTAGIEAFQAQNGLAVDGVLRPNGETIQTLDRSLKAGTANGEDNHNIGSVMQKRQKENITNNGEKPLKEKQEPAIVNLFYQK